jgi:hypothetical protein
MLINFDGNCFVIKVKLVYLLDRKWVGLALFEIRKF